MAPEEEIQEFPCKVSGCKGKVHYVRQTIPALSRMMTVAYRTEKKVVYLPCDNPDGEPHIRPYDV